MVAAYLSWRSGRKASTIGRHAAAIGYHHKIAGHEPPTSAEGVRAVLRGIRRTIGAAKQGKRSASQAPFAAASWCALEVADLTEVPDRLRILVRRSKGD